MSLFACQIFGIFLLSPFLINLVLVAHYHLRPPKNPEGISSNAERAPIHPYFIVEDLGTILLFFIAPTHVLVILETFITCRS